jgi:exodeoxyribonuclease VII large subunit
MPGRQIDVNEGGDELRVTFPYDARLVAVVRALPRRRFDGLTKVWLCPAEDAREVIELLVDHGFALTAAARALYRKQGGTALPEANGGDAGASVADRPTLFDRIVAKSKGDAAAPAADAASSGAAASLTVSELNARVQRALLRAFPETLWIVGEIAGYDRNKHRPHVHFELVEKAGEAEGGAVKSTVGAVLFERTRRDLERTLAQSEAPFELKDGIEVRLQVRVDLYVPRGSYQLVVEAIDPVHTLGKLAQNRAAVLAELDRRGLREKNRSLPWPEVPLRVGLITSAGSDAYNDFVNELARSGFAFALTVADARMQGAGLEKGLVRAVERFGARAAEFDVLAIVRGGGARTDLLWFDNLAVALAVAQCPIKVVSGIGHQRDVSVVDLIAHPEKTPTAAAAAVVARVQEFETRLEDGFAQLADRVARALDDESDRLGEAGGELERATRAALRLERTRLAAATRGLVPATRARLREGRRALADARVRLLSFARAKARLERAALGGLARRFDPARLRVVFERRDARLADLDRLAHSLHPRAVLRRGFALVQDERGRTLRTAADAPAGSRVVATLAHGRLHVRVDRTEDETPPRSP